MKVQGSQLRGVCPNASEALPPDAGIYLLFLWLPVSHSLDIGRLNEQDYPPGLYAYVGSACGPGGLRARLGRHLSGQGKKRWHIDGLRVHATMASYAYLTLHDLSGGTGQQDGSTAMRLECQLAQSLAGVPGVTVPVPGFGASDCRSGCPAHLFHLASYAAASPVLSRDQLFFLGDQDGLQCGIGGAL